VQLARLLRRPVPPEARELHGIFAMVGAVWRHRIRGVPTTVSTLYFHSGHDDGAGIGLSGRWRDHVLGWSAEPGNFDIHQFNSVHTEIMYHPDAVDILRDRLHQVNASTEGDARNSSPAPVSMSG